MHLSVWDMVCTFKLCTFTEIFFPSIKNNMALTGQLGKYLIRGLSIIAFPNNSTALRGFLL